MAVKRTDTFVKLKNPYTFGVPVRGEGKFFGREEELQIIFDTLNNVPRGQKQDMVVMGPRRIGKSSLLYRLIDLLSANEDFVPVYIDLQNIQPKKIRILFLKILQRIQDGYKQKNLLTELPSFDTLKSVDIPPDLEFLTFDEDLSRLNEAITTRNLPRLILIFDEVESLTEFGGISILEGFRSLIQTLGYCIFVVAGSDRLYELTTDYTSPFYNIFKTIRVRALSTKTAKLLITEPAKTVGLIYPSAEIDRILHYTGNNPFFIQAMGHYLVESLNQRGRYLIQTDDVDKIAKQMIDNLSSQFNNLWRNFKITEQGLLYLLTSQQTPQTASNLAELFFDLTNVRLSKQEYQNIFAGLSDQQVLQPATSEAKETQYWFVVQLFADWIHAKIRPEEITGPIENIVAADGTVLTELAIVVSDNVNVSDEVFIGISEGPDIFTTANPDDLWQAITHQRPSADIRQAIRSYLRYLIDRYRHIDFRGMGVSSRAYPRFPLVDMYVLPKARIEIPEGDTWDRPLRLAEHQVSQGEAGAIGKQLSKPQPVLDLLRRHSGLIILGDPGAGKTTFLKYLALRLAMGEKGGLGLEDRLRLPVLLPLSAYANVLAEQDIPLDRFIPAYYRERGIDLPLEAMFKQALASGGTLLLLDGLDEVKDLSQRHLVVNRVVDFFTVQQRKGNKFILTSRVVGYREVRPVVGGLAECTLVDFGDEEITEFVKKWVGAAEQMVRDDPLVTAQQAQRERQELLSAINYNRDIRSLAANPLLLSILVLMKRQGIALPKRRVELYQSYVETLLRTWNLARGLYRPVSRSLDTVETIRLLAPLALWMHETSLDGLIKREALRRKLIEICRGRQIEKPEQTADRLITDMREHAGLLLERGVGEYGFIHLTFQEYLAAIAIALRSQREIKEISDILAAHVDDDNWREVILLTVGYIGIIQQQDEVAGQVAWNLVGASGQPGRGAVLAGEAMLDLWPGGVTESCKNEIVEALQTLLIDKKIKPGLRVEAGVILGRLGDTRPGVGLRADGRPDIIWREVPAGTFLMGTDRAKDRRASADETPQHKVTLPTYKIGRYAVTNAQYWAFVEAGGYQNKQYWLEAIVARGWLAGKVKGYDETEREAPADYGTPFDLANHPVVGVTWYEAMAYCRWLTEVLQDIGEIKSDEQVRLPTEAEWEKAARGIDGRLYPWGGKPDPNRANHKDTGIGSISAVGCFPDGASPYGVDDMAGNVWEWTRSLWGKEFTETNFKYPYHSTDGREDISANDDILRVVRGGSFENDERNIRCTMRYRYRATFRHGYCGFRVAVIPVQPTSLQ